VLYPLTFQPIFKERVWGGRRLERLYGKALPAGATIGESWEISDRPGDVSVIANGPLAGRDLRWLMASHSAELLGTAQPMGGRFPLLVKLLDAQDKLSLQVHPPADRAAQLGGESKTEAWYFAATEPGAEIYAGLRRGTTRADFEQRLRDGTVAECFHRLPVQRGDAMFLPSGRVHALGAGSVLFEIQQNSDTTYRVFDWNRVGLDGQPRALHVASALASIAFDDFEPALAPVTFAETPAGRCRTIANAKGLFELSEERPRAGTTAVFERAGLFILGVVEGEIALRGAGVELVLRPGQFALMPACVERAEVCAKTDSIWLRATPSIP
jgi:mannose-6-phosphate isomerase